KELRMSAENIEIENRFAARGNLPEARFLRPFEGDRRGTKCHWLQPEMTGEKDGAGSVKIIRDDRQLGQTEDRLRPGEGIERAKASIIESHRGKRHACGKECVAHVTRFIVTSKVIIAAEQK